MTLRLIQLLTEGGERVVAATQGGTKARRVKGASSVYTLATSAIASNTTLAKAVERCGYG